MYFWALHDTHLNIHLKNLPIKSNRKSVGNIWPNLFISSYKNIRGKQCAQIF